METNLILLIRADASVASGTGHVMRMVALGQEWQERGGKVCFVAAEITPTLQRRLANEGFTLHQIDVSPGSAEDLAATCAIIHRLPNKNVHVALDGYHFNDGFELGLKRTGSCLLVMDDYGHAEHASADVVLNQNISAGPELYPNLSPHTELLVGPRFALLRKEFLRYRGLRRKTPAAARKVLVTFGGSDPENFTQSIIEAIEKLDLEVKLLIGGSNPHLPSLRQNVDNLKSRAARFDLVVNAVNIPELMLWADVAVAAAGSTILELDYMGLPTLVFAISSNQQPLLPHLKMFPLLESCGHAKDITNVDITQALERLLNHARRHPHLRSQIDGSGAMRVVDKMIQVLGFL
jgi:UDP-2,4-diacetamido-2,4,6-trideoxy-beta-L-altropyranose hydrolase